MTAHKNVSLGARGKYRLQIRVNGHQLNLGRYDSEDEVLLARAVVYDHLGLIDPYEIEITEADLERHEHLLERIEDAKARAPLAKTERAPRLQRRTKSEIELERRLTDLETRHAALAGAFEQHMLEHVTAA